MGLIGIFTLTMSKFFFHVFISAGHVIGWGLLFAATVDAPPSLSSMWMDQAYNTDDKMVILPMDLIISMNDPEQDNITHYKSSRATTWDYIAQVCHLFCTNIINILLQKTI